MSNNISNYSKGRFSVCFSVFIILFVLLTSLTDCHSRGGYFEHRLNQLQAGKDLYEQHLKDNFDLLKSYLSPDHLTNLQDTELFITLDDDILIARAHGNQNRIIISSALIIFLDELAVTKAYFDYLGKTDFQPIINYVLLLRKNMRRNELGREIIPTMPEAIGVPDKEIWARNNDDSTKTLAQNFLKSAVTWILAHEMGHIALNHFTQPPGNMDNLQKAEYNRKLEMEADEFATELMASVRLAPVGMALSIHYYSLLFPIRMEFKYEEDWQEYLAGQSHPVWPDRLENLARLLRRNQTNFNLNNNTMELIAQRLKSLAQGLNKRDIIDGMVLGSENLTFQNLMTFRPLENINKKYYLPRDER